MTCTWTPDPACLTNEWDELSDVERDRALMLATSSLQTLTYGRVGTCPITVRMTSEKPPCGLWEPYPLADRWLNTCGCRTAHWSDALNEVTLDGPIGYVEAIKVDGVNLPLDNDNWRVDNGSILVWQGEGPSPLPKIQDLSKADTEIGTWSITYSQSYPVNADAQIAVAYLALEFARACQAKPKTKCSLPRGVTSVARAGVNFTIGDKSLFPGGLTGIDVVDQFILKWAPVGSPTQNAVVFDPSKINQTRRTSRLRTKPVEPTSPVVLSVRKGSTFVRAWQVSYADAAIDSTWVARGQIRDKVGGALLLDLTPVVLPGGVVQVEIPPATSAGFTWNSAVYGVEVESTSGVVLRVAQGRITASDEVVV